MRKSVLNLIRWASVLSNLIVIMAIIYNNNHLCRIINYCVMYRTQHNDGREGDREVVKRREERGGKKGGRSEKKEIGREEEN